MKLAVDIVFSFCILSLISITHIVDAAYLELNVENRQDDILFNGVLRYKVENGPRLDFDYRECYINSATLPKYKPGVGVWSSCHPAIMNKLGLFFPQGHDASAITEAYDDFTETFYPCSRADNGFANHRWTTFTCGPIPLVFKDNVPPPPSTPPLYPECPESEWIPVVKMGIAFSFLAVFVMALTRNSNESRAGELRLPNP